MTNKIEKMRGTMDKPERNQATLHARKEVTDLVNKAMKSTDFKTKKLIIDVLSQEDGLLIGSAGFASYDDVCTISVYEKKPFPQWRDRVDKISEIVNPAWFLGMIAAAGILWFSVLLYGHMFYGIDFPFWGSVWSLVMAVGGAITAGITSSECVDWWWVKDGFAAPDGAFFITRNAGQQLSYALSSLTPENRKEYTGLIKNVMEDYDSNAEFSVWVEQLAEILKISPDYPASVVPLTLVNITEAKNMLVRRVGKARALELKEIEDMKKLEKSLREEFDAPLKDSALDFISTIPLETLK